MILVVGSIVIAALGLLGVYLVSLRRRTGWIFSVGASLAALPYDALTHQWGFIATSVVGLVIAARAYRRWE